MNSSPPTYKLLFQMNSIYYHSTRSTTSLHSETHEREPPRVMHLHFRLKNKTTLSLPFQKGLHVKRAANIYH